MNKQEGNKEDMKKIKSRKIDPDILKQEKEKKKLAASSNQIIKK